MIEKMSESGRKLIGFRVRGSVVRDDYAALIPKVQELVDREGSIGMPIDLDHLEWKKADARRADLTFGQAYRQPIDRLAPQPPSGMATIISAMPTPARIRPTFQGTASA